jgi:hypothetical protein
MKKERLRSRELKLTAGERCADHEPPLNPQNLALTSPASGGRLDGVLCLPSETVASYCGLRLHQSHQGVSLSPFELQPDMWLLWGPSW